MKLDKMLTTNSRWRRIAFCFLTLTTFFIAQSTRSEQGLKYATTDDGFRIRVNANGSWAYPGTGFKEIVGAYERVSGRIGSGFPKYFSIGKSHSPNIYVIREKSELLDAWTDCCTGSLHAGKLQGSRGGANIDIAFEDSRLLITVGNAFVQETAYYGRIEIEQLTREAEERAAKEAKRWGPLEGQMKWDQAASLCKARGMRLPTVEEIHSATKSGARILWRRDSPKDYGAYWSSQHGTAGYKVAYGEKDAYDAGPDQAVDVRCFREN
ncbi:MAG: hypothetical protein K8S54_03660 [Spirochaetia bacterium]|nr:hypothetical protein [Spirochaetia bacterium]